jgi:hypothetical protein
MYYTYDKYKKNNTEMYYIHLFSTIFVQKDE